MRGRSDCLYNWGINLPSTFPSGPGTIRPFAFDIVLPNPDKTGIDTIAAIYYRYKTLIARMEGSFGFSSSFTIAGDDWTLQLSGNYSMDAIAPSGGTQEGDRYVYFFGGGGSSQFVTFNGSATLKNETTGDVWGTDEPEPNKLAFVGQSNGFVSLTRGDRIFSREQDDKITMEFVVRGQIGVSCKSTTASSPSISTIFFAQRRTDNDDNAYSAAGTCGFNIFNLYGTPSPIPIFNDPHTETPVVTIVVGAGSAELEGRASSSANFTILGGEVWPYGFNPADHDALTTLNRLWSTDGTPVFDLPTILNAPLDAP